MLPSWLTLLNKQAAVEQSSLAVEWNYVSTPMYPFYMVKERAIYIHLRTEVLMYQFLPLQNFHQPNHELCSGSAP